MSRRTGGGTSAGKVFSTFYLEANAEFDEAFADFRYAGLLEKGIVATLAGTRLFSLGDAARLALQEQLSSLLRPWARTVAPPDGHTTSQNARHIRGGRFCCHRRHIQNGSDRHRPILDFSCGFSHFLGIFGILPMASASGWVPNAHHTLRQNRCSRVLHFTSAVKGRSGRINYAAHAC